jgi:hypothetical protein
MFLLLLVARENVEKRGPGQVAKVQTDFPSGRNLDGTACALILDTASRD